MSREIADDFSNFYFINKGRTKIWHNFLESSYKDQKLFFKFQKDFRMRKNNLLFTLPASLALIKNETFLGIFKHCEFSRMELTSKQIVLASLTLLTSLVVVRNDTFYDLQEHNECRFAKNKIKLASLALTTKAQRKATKSSCLFSLSFD